MDAAPPEAFPPFPTPAITKTFTHTGPISNLPPKPSRGLLFLKDFLAALSSLSPMLPMNAFLRSDCKIIRNGGDAITPEQNSENLTSRNSVVKKFKCELVRAWDVHQEKSNSRTILFESLSTRIFAHDPEKRKIRTSEYTILELQTVREPQLLLQQKEENGEGEAAREGGIGMGTPLQVLEVVKMSVWVDTAPVVERLDKIAIGARRGDVWSYKNAWF